METEYDRCVDDCAEICEGDVECFDECEAYCDWYYLPEFDYDDDDWGEE